MVTSSIPYFSSFLDCFVAILFLNQGTPYLLESSRTQHAGAGFLPTIDEAMQAPPQMPRRRTEFDEEFDIMKQIQENRMTYREGLVCHDRCIKHFWFNNFYLWDKSCMQNCLEQMNQVTVITNIAHGMFEEQRRNPAKK